EEYPLHPESPYAASKAIAEQMIQDYYRAYGQHYCILRYFNACGSDPDGELGADPYKETRVVAVAMKAGILHQPFSLFGTDWPTPDQTAVRDYIHVSDLAGAHVAALHALLDGRESSLICNLGIGRGLSVFEIIQGVEEVLGYALDVRIHPRRPGDVAVSIADATRMRTRLHFEPSHSSLKEIMRTTYRWQSHLLGPQNQLRAAS
ncbi:MAG: NAD-dependent epimerase/dehydratase family protein, partial [Chlamydiia bacterium]